MAFKLFKKLKRDAPGEPLAATRVLKTYELLESILLYLDPHNLRQARLVSATWLALINQSSPLTAKLKASSKSRLIKLLLLGDGGTGGRCLIERWCHDGYTETYNVTLEDSWRKHVCLDERHVMLELQRPYGLEEYIALYEMMLRDTDAYLVMYSVCSRQSFDSIRRRVSKIQQSPTLDKPLLALVATKCDLIDQYGEVSVEEGESLARELGCSFFQTSAKVPNANEPTLADLVREYRDVRWSQRPVATPIEPRQETRGATTTHPALAMKAFLRKISSRSRDTSAVEKQTDHFVSKIGPCPQL